MNGLFNRAGEASIFTNETVFLLKELKNYASFAKARVLQKNEMQDRLVA